MTIQLGRCSLSAMALCFLATLVLGGSPAPRAFADTPQRYFCIDGTYPTSWGISEASSPPAGMECYTSLDALYAAKNLPSVEFWNSLPSYTNTNVPAPGMFDAVDCRLTSWRGMRLLPGEVYWGRCQNGLRVSFSGPAPDLDEVWWAPPPHTSFVAAYRLGIRVPKLIAFLSSVS